MADIYCSECQQWSVEYSQLEKLLLDIPICPPEGTWSNGDSAQEAGWMEAIQTMRCLLGKPDPHYRTPPYVEQLNLNKAKKG